MREAASAGQISKRWRRNIRYAARSDRPHTGAAVAWEETTYTYCAHLSAPCAPFALTTCAPSMAHATAGFTSPSGACSACASPIFVESASPPGTACAALGAPFCSARAPRGSTRDPRGAGGPSGPWGSARTARLARRGLGRSALMIPATFAIYTPLRTYQQHALAPQALAPQALRPGRRRAVRAPVGDAAAPSRCGTRSTDGGRPASRSSSPAGSCHSAMGGAAAQGACAACAALARLWRRVSATRDRPLRQPRTVPPCPADASRPR